MGKARVQTQNFSQKLGKVAKAKWDKNLYPESYFHNSFEIFLLFEREEYREENNTNEEKFTEI